MKIYARQVDPQFQYSPIFDDDTMGIDYINVYGNKDYEQRTSSLFDRVKECLDNGELASDIEAIEEKNADAIYGNVTEAINNQLWRDDGKTYSACQIGKLKNLILLYSSCGSSDEDQILVDILSIVTGDEWSYKTIRGSSQSEWNVIYYPIKYWTEKTLEAFEIMYFNEGTEWIIHDGDTEPNGAEDINGYTLYCLSWNDEGIKKEIAEEVGESVDNIILYKHSGYIYTPKYEIA